MQSQKDSGPSGSTDNESGDEHHAGNEESESGGVGGGGSESGRGIGGETIVDGRIGTGELIGVHGQELGPDIAVTAPREDDGGSSDGSEGEGVVMMKGLSKGRKDGLVGKAGGDGVAGKGKGVGGKDKGEGMGRRGGGEGEGEESADSDVDEEMRFGGEGLEGFVHSPRGIDEDRDSPGMGRK